MNIINRGQIVIFPTKNFEAWALQHSEDELYFSENPEPSVYLIEEEFWEDELVLEKYRKKIIKRECSEICSEEEKWPIIKNNEQFRHYFKAHLGIMVIDLLDSDLISEEIAL
jgi:hypothetical protein